MSDYATQDFSRLATAGSRQNGRADIGTIVSSRSPGSGEASAKAGTLAVGEYLVGDTEDILLSGHPDIRY